MSFQIPEFVRKVIERLRKSGHDAYIVGGAVRDLCMKREPVDWDITTSARPHEIESVFKDIKHFSLWHDTITLVHNQKEYEISSFRGTSGRLEEDLGLRDFTINAMAFDMESGRVIDPYAGQADIAKRLIRGVIKPENRFREDPLRLLRAVRISSEIRFKIEDTTFHTISNMAHEINACAPERIRDELIKILLTPKPSEGFNLMVKTNLMTELIPELMEGYRIKEGFSHKYTIFRHLLETTDRVRPEIHLRLAALLHDIGKPRVRKRIDGGWSFQGHEEQGEKLSISIMKRLCFSGVLIKRVAHLIRHHNIYYDPGWKEADLIRFIMDVGEENLDDLLELRYADIKAGENDNRELGVFLNLTARVLAIKNKGTLDKVRRLAINGRDIMEYLGIKEGPEVGEILEYLRGKVYENPIINNKKELLKILEKIKP